ncbi:MAG: AAA family ATPase [Gemmatimonadetes bacterium]|nr:AAA family ATPase [Gemmatimonadota bacterium]
MNGTRDAAANGFPTRAPVELEDRPRQQQWLIDGLWGRQAVGIVGGEPKCGKSFLALDLAVAVAAGVPCLRRFAADEPGPVLLFAAEDAGHIVRARLQGIASAAGARFESLDIAVIDVPALRLDHRADRQRLVETVERIRPRLVVLDPLVRLHGVDENTVAEVAPILGFLRDIQRRFGAAVLLVHHARKSGATRPGQALRGSSELHAWGDSNLYLRRRDRQIVMTVEHRAAPGLNDIELELADDGKGPALRLRQVETAEAAPEPDTPERRILKALAEATTPLSQRQIRERAATRHKTVGVVLKKLVREGRVRHDAEGHYGLAAGQAEKAPPAANGSHPDNARFPVPGSAHP